MSKIIRVRSETTLDEAATTAAHVMRQGGVVVFPTTGLYGLAAHALDPQAAARIFSVKRRPPDKALLVLINDLEQVSPLVKEIPPEAKALMEKLWPGGITLLFEASDELPSVLCAGTGKIGIRMAAHPVARAMVKALGSPITGTSANLSGSPGVSDFSLMAPEILEAVDLAIDAGTLAGGPGSTIADVTVSPPAILRQGAVAPEAVYQAIE